MSAVPQSLGVGHMPRASRDAAIQSAVALTAVALVAAPVLIITWQSLQTAALYEPMGPLTLANYAALLTNVRFRDALLNSLAIAAIGTVVALVVGVTLAILLTRVRLPARNAIGEFVVAPIYISQLVLAFGWYMVYGPSGYLTLWFLQQFGLQPWNLYSLGGIGLLAGLAQVPMIYLYCSSSLRLADSALEDAARSAGAGPLRTIFSVSLPMLRPAIVYGALLTFVGSIEMLSIPLVFGSPVRIEVFTTFLYREGIGPTTPDYGMLGAAATLMLLTMTVLIALQGWLLGRSRRFVSVRGRASRHRPLDLGAWRYPAAALVGLYVTLVIVLPLAALLLRSVVDFLTPLVAPWEFLTLDHFHQILTLPAYARAIVNSFFVAGFGGLAATLLVALIAAIVHRSSFRGGRFLEAVALYPRAIPGIVAGIGYMWVTLLVPPLSVLHGTLWILCLAFTARNLPTAYGAIAPAMIQIAPELDQGARTCGADWWTACRKIVLPVARPALLSAYLLMFLAFFKEYASAVFLFAPGSEIIGTVMLHLWANGDFGPVAALSAIQIVVALLFVYLLRRFAGVGAYGQAQG